MPRDQPDPQERVLAALHVLVHGPYCSASQRATLLHPHTGPLGHNGVMVQAEKVLAATVRAVFAELHPQGLDRISQAVEQALANWPPQFREQGGGTHFRPE